MNNQQVSPSWLLLRYTLATKHTLAIIAEKHNLNLSQAFALCLVYDLESITMNKLGLLMHCDASNITGIVDKLYSAKLLERKECATDRRVKLLSLTTSGVAIAKNIMAELEISCTTKAITTQLSNEERVIFNQLLYKLLQFSEK